MNEADRDAKQPNIKKLMIFIGVAVAAFALYAIFGSIFTGNTPEADQGIGAINQADSAIVQPSDTIRGDTIVR